MNLNQMINCMIMNNICDFLICNHKDLKYKIEDLRVAYQIKIKTSPIIVRRTYRSGTPKLEAIDHKGDKIWGPARARPIGSPSPIGATNNGNN